MTGVQTCALPISRVIDSGPEFDHALQLLAGKHEQYLRGAPRGPDMLQGTQAGTAAALDLPGAWLTDAQKASRGRRR